MGFPEVQNNSIDLVIADPPFGINFDKGNNYNRTNDSREGYLEIKSDNYQYFCYSKFMDLKRVIKPEAVIVWFSACVTKDKVEDRLMTVLEAAKQAGLYRQRDIIWGYQFGVYNPTNFTISHQHVLMFTVHPDITFKWNGHYEEDAVYLKRKYNHGIKTNITETNEELTKWLISLLSYKGDIILDPFFGSGTTGKVCSELERNCIGYEINTNMRDRISEKLKGIEYQVIQNG